MIEGLSYGNVLICMNGHVTTTKANSDQIPEKFCATCGAEIINKCLKCSAYIKGTPRYASQIDGPYAYFGDVYVRQSYCTNCGEAHPWTLRGESAAYELIEFATALTPQEREDWKQTIPALIKDSPKSSVALIKFKAYAAKAGIEIGKAVKDIVVGVVSEVVKNAILK
jgi:hypothetical protein